MKTAQKIDSSELVKTGVAKLRNSLGAKGFTLSIHSDDRLEKIVRDVKEQIRSHGWKIPQDEKQICLAVLRTMHLEKYYGRYDAKTLRNLETENVLESMMDSDVSFMGKEELATRKKYLEKEYGKVKRHGDKEDKERSGVELKNYRSGTLVCREEAVVASYVLDRVGISNEIILTNVRLEPGRTDAHAFIQSKLGKKNIIDAITPDGYYRNMNGGRVANSEVVIAQSSKMTYIYGVGEVDMLTALRSSFKGGGREAMERHFQKNIEKSIRDFEEKGGVMKTQATSDKALKEGKDGFVLTEVYAKLANQFIKADVDKNGILTTSERKNSAKTAVDMSNLGLKGDVTLREFGKIMKEHYNMIDRDHNGYVTMQEFFAAKTDKPAVSK